MAKQYGAYVGTPRNSAPPKLVPHGFENGSDHIIVRDTVELAAAAADMVQLAVLGWECVLDPDGCKVWFDDLGTGGTISIGDVTYPAALAATVNTDSAAGNTNMLAAIDIANYFKPLWQMLGYATLAAAKLVGGRCELLLTRNATSGAGTVTWQIKGQRRI